MAILVDGVPQEIRTQQFENLTGFQLILLSSSFATWANQSPSHAAAISANFVARDFDAVKVAYAQLVAMYPPTTQQLSEWQAIADANQITSLRFVPS